MCGIIAGINGNDMAHSLIDGLLKLEYRGYDSAGLAVIGKHGLAVRKVSGPVDGLALDVRKRPAEGSIGIAHTRWATHGEPSATNAHPHLCGDIAVVHNGIIENHHALRWGLKDAGHAFHSETDSEVIPHLIGEAMKAGADLLDATRAAVRQLKGRYAFIVMHKNAPDRLIAVQQGSSIVVGTGPHGAWAASDDLALMGRVERTADLEEGNIAILTRAGVEMHDTNLALVAPEWNDAEPTTDLGVSALDGTHTRREISEQPEAIRKTLLGLANRDVPVSIINAQRILICACGSSFYAGMLARNWFENLAGMRVEMEIGSELSTRPMIDMDGTVAVLISQSGETADTLAALDTLQSAKVPTIAVVNVERSQLANRADVHWPTSAGREIGVAATKTFVTQVTALGALALRIATLKGTLALDLEHGLRRELEGMGSAIAKIIETEPHIASIAKEIAQARSCLFLGRGPDYSVAAEAALKLKELSYIHAEAYPAGELKHGPIAIIHKGLPVIASAGQGPLLAKTLSNLAEVKARGAKTILVTEQNANIEGDADHTILVPSGSPYVSPVYRVIALQLLAFHVAKVLDLDIDKPRNLAKSVTVE